ncbi:DUF4760 domain-containing protein [Snodgrassella communis]|uniref:DUF4760 domain-containing protein n=1 Tax=Snodgrassella communis TaxID=2946699 RepID=UPI000C1F1996|nr:DUF4760 domain-containing protein [Snodgrassella communis]
MLLDTETFRFLGETIGYWLQTIAIVASAIFAGSQIRALRKQHTSNDIQWKQRATVDAVIADKRDATLINSRLMYAKLKENNTDFNTIGAQSLLANEKENQAILDVLNNYEFMAAGIKEGAFDEEIYKRMKRSLVIKDWEKLELYVRALRKREQRDRLFSEFQWLAEKWMAEDDA